MNTQVLVGPDGSVRALRVNGVGRGCFSNWRLSTQNVPEPPRLTTPTLMSRRPEGRFSPGTSCTS